MYDIFCSVELKNQHVQQYTLDIGFRLLDISAQTLWNEENTVFSQSLIINVNFKLIILIIVSLFGFQCRCLVIYYIYIFMWDYEGATIKLNFFGVEEKLEGRRII